MAESTLADVIIGESNNGAELALNLASKLDLAPGNTRSTNSRTLSTANLLIIVTSRLLEGKCSDDLQRDLICKRVADALTSFLKKVISSTKIDDASILTKDSAALCAKSSQLLGGQFTDHLIQFCNRIVQDYIREHYDEQHFVINQPELHGSLLSLLTDRVEVAEEGFSQCDEEVVLSVLSFIRNILWQGNTTTGVYTDLLWLLLVLQNAKSAELASTSRDTILSLLSSNIRSAQIIEEGQGINRLWCSLVALVHDRQNTVKCTNAYQIWLTLLACRLEWVEVSGWYHKTEYWSLLQDGLATGTQQQRKLCLAILKASLLGIKEDINCSVMTFQVLEKADLMERYEKYATIFVTVVVNRYANQVQDALEELLSLFQMNSGVDTPWLVSLLSAALDKGMQDSVRKVFGNLVMDHAAELLARDNASTGAYLEKHFLPWAVNGSLFVSTIQKSGSSMSCQHGAKLSDFVKNIILKTEDDETRNGIIIVVLHYLSEHNDHAFPYAKAYILEGISSSLLARPILLNDNSTYLLSRIASQGGYLEIVRHWVACTIAGLAMFTAPDGKDTDMARVKREAENFAQAGLIRLQEPSISAKVLAAGFSEDPADDSSNLATEFSVSQFCKWLRLSSHACLVQDRLVAGCVYFKEALRNSPCQPVEVLEALEALWEQLEVQEFGRDALMEFPGLLLHQTCLELCERDTEVLAFVSEKLSILQDLSQYRMHLFSALVDALRRVVLHEPNASMLPLDSIMVKFATSPPATKTEFQLEFIFSIKLGKLMPDATYEAFYGKSEGWAYAAFFDMLNAMPESDELSSHCSRALDALMLPWVQQKHPVPMVSKWKNTVQLQVIIILLHRRLQRCTPDESTGYFNKILGMLAVEPLPRFRFLLEWGIARMFVLARPRMELLDYMQSIDASNPKLCVSLVKVALGLACMQDADEEFASEFMTQLVVLSASPKVAIRHEGQWSIPILWDHAHQRKWQSILQNPAGARLNAWLRTLEPYKKPPAYRMLEQFDPVRSHNLGNLLDGDYLTMEPPEMSRTDYTEFISLHEDDAKQSGQYERGEQAGSLALGPSKKFLASHRSEAEPPKVQDTAASSPASRPLQTKGATWRAEIDTLLSGLASTGTARRPRDLIVVASLIDNAYNVGGLSRAAEIFGAASLIVNDERVLKTKDFTSVAVSSELWLPIEQVPGGADTLIPWLTSKRIQGYTVIGIEQTDDSRVLGASSTVLPKRLVLVLGSEREGIPARILQACDWCVEVPQRGVTRSMNVQTAAAVVLYEYERQHGTATT